jgi:sialate O-acetylesterase
VTALRLWLFFGLAIAVLNSRAEVTLAPLLRDHAVLQSNQPVPIWGWAKPGAHVTVAFAGQNVGATAEGDGSWVALLSPLEVNQKASDLVATGGNTVTIHDILVGEVWLCSGQSNMEFTVDDPVRTDFRVLNAPQEVGAANYPLIRQFRVARRASPDASATFDGSWSVCSPETVAAFTAVGYFFARDIHRRLGVPVGLINSAWGGTGIEAWISPASQADLSRQAVAAGHAIPPEIQPRRPGPPDPRWSSGKDTVGEGDPTIPTSLFNGMINPLLPYSVRGILWYQGEHNAGQPARYEPLFLSLITHWRLHLGNPELPFYWVQLANFKTASDASGRSWAFLREAQARALTLPATGQAVTIDIGDPRTVHPRNKQEVGRRLALIAKAKVYGIPVDFSGPVFEWAAREGSRMRVHFKFADNALTAGAKPLQSFEIAGADRHFHPAVATIEGGTVVVYAPEVREPVAVRYAWSDDPEANLYNGAGLPAMPFRSDDW